MSRHIVWMIADLHSGHKLGLLNPKTVLDDIDEKGRLGQFSPKLGLMQKYLWKRCTDDTKQIVDLAGDDEIILVVLGDLHQGVKYPDQLVSMRVADHIMIGYYNLLPIVELPNVKAVRIIQGTEAHNFGNGSSEVLATKLLEGTGKDVKCTVHSLIDIGGVKFDLAHHGPHPGSRKWLEGNIARLYLRNAMMTDVELGVKPASVYARAHYHTYRHVADWMEYNGCEAESHLVILPSYFGMTSHARKVTRSVPVQVHGCVAVEVDDSTVKIHRFTKTLDMRTKERL